VTEQIPDESVQVMEENVPPEMLALKVTVPVGIICVPDPVSLTVTVHVVVPSGRIEFGLQITETDTCLGVT